MRNDGHRHHDEAAQPTAYLPFIAPQAGAITYAA